MRRILLLLISLTLLPALTLARDKDSTLEGIIKDEVMHDEKSKGKGRPNNPGEHGRDNAAAKQAVNPGKGSSNHSSSMESVIDDVFGEDDDREWKDNDEKEKKKNTNKNKNK